MSDTALGASALGASGAASAQEFWVLARATVPFAGLRRGETVVINPDDAETKHYLQNTYLEILPASEQPRITVDHATMQPTIHERNKMLRGDQVTVSDMSSDTPNTFLGFVLDDASSDVGTETSVGVAVNKEPNGFGWPVGFQVAMLKRLGNGFYGA